jgi:flavin-dependent dehydrogenase
MPIVAKEAEFLATATSVAADLPELFFCRDLDGYGWCVRKGDFLNIGIGRRDRGGGADLNAHVRDFTTFLRDSGRARDAADVRWCGHAYLAGGAGARPCVDDGVLLVGDAAGLAYPESGEGIKPAVESGRLAAETLLAAGGRVDRAALAPYARAIRQRHPAPMRIPTPLASASQALGRALLASPTFTRRVVIDRWFLRT